MDENHTYILCVLVYVTGCSRVPLVKQLARLSVKALTTCTSVLENVNQPKVSTFSCLMRSVFPRIAPVVHPHEGNA